MSSSVYIITYSEGIKIGKTGNLKRRLDQYNRPWIKNPESIYTAPVDCHHFGERLIRLYVKEMKEGKQYKNSDFFFGLKGSDVVKEIESKSSIRFKRGSLK